MFATNENYLYGCNLLNLHGLYYTTHGSFWEWAPPSYHFRMPYWDHMGVFLKYFERLSYLFSQGVLQTDIAVMYPVTPAQAEMRKQGEATGVAFDSGRKLFNNGYDFIFMDHQSLGRSVVSNGRFHVSDGSYKVLVLPAMNAIRWTTLEKALEFYREGGVVTAIGMLPEASDRTGSNDGELDAVVKEIFGANAKELSFGNTIERQVNDAGGKGLFVRNSDELLEELDKILPRDVQSDQKVRAQHRKIGPRDVYMVMGAEKGSWCTFRSKGKVEHWDPWTGETTELFEVNETEDGTKVKMPLATNEAQVIVFSPEKREAEIVTTQLDEIKGVKVSDGKVTVSGYADSPGRKSATLMVNGKMQTVSGDASTAPVPMTLDGDWEFELKPTMDNRWGDFRLPVTEKIIGAEARIFSYAKGAENISGWESPDTDDSKWERVTHGYGQKFWKLGPLPSDLDFKKLDEMLSSMKVVDPSQPVMTDSEIYNWQPYDFSWKMGVEDDPGYQGWHGLKEQVSDEFICLGRKIRKNNDSRYILEDGGTSYYLWTSAYTDENCIAEIETGGMKPDAIYINGKRISDSGRKIRLHKGNTPLLLRYDEPGRGYFVLRKNNNSVSERQPLSMKWWGDKDLIQFDVSPESKDPFGWYRFKAPAGLKSMKFKSAGNVSVFVDGERQGVEQTVEGDFYSNMVKLDKVFSRKSEVAIRVDQIRGCYGGSAIPEPVFLECGKGIDHTGDWSKNSALECYSGGVWYRKNITLTKEQAASRVILDMGRVVATAEVLINGQSAGTLVSPPWKLDVSELVREGDNKIEILVYNTLANHYRTIPSRYKGDSLESGLIGPVKLEFTAKVELVN